MDQITKVRKCIKQEQWKVLITQCQSSGMSVKSWCRTNGICEQTYYRNLKKLREEMIDSLPVAVSETKPPAIFEKLEVQTPIPDTKAAVIIHLPSATIEVLNGTNQQTVEAVLLALKAIC